MRSPESQPLSDGIYRLYNVTLTDDRFVYELAGRFEISSEDVTLLHDPTGLLTRHLGNGPLTPQKRRFLFSLARGSYRVVVREEPGIGTCRGTPTPHRKAGHPAS